MLDYAKTQKFIIDILNHKPERLSIGFCDYMCEPMNCFIVDTTYILLIPVKRTMLDVNYIIDSYNLPLPETMKGILSRLLRGDAAYYLPACKDTKLVVKRGGIMRRVLIEKDEQSIEIINKPVELMDKYCDPVFATEPGRGKPVYLFGVGNVTTLDAVVMPAYFTEERGD